MKPTIEYIKQKFEEYNVLCFGGKLPLPAFQLSNARTFLGQVAYRRTKRPNGSWHYSDFVFKISSKTERPEDVVQDTILHEMIHYYILYNQLQDTSSHGVIFRKMMNAINQRFNRNITVSHNDTKEEKEADTERRQHLICVSQLNNGHKGITIAAKTRLFDLWDELPRISIVKECKWYVSTDPYFNRFRRTLTAKIYRIPQDELEEHIANARELIRQGNRIWTAPKNETGE